MTFWLKILTFLRIALTWSKRGLIQIVDLIDWSPAEIAEIEQKIKNARKIKI